MISIKSTNCIDGFKKILRMSRFCGIIPLDEHCHLGLALATFTVVIYLLLLAFISLWFWLQYVGLKNNDTIFFSTFFRNCCCTTSLILISYRFAQKRLELRAVMWSLAVIDKAFIAENIPWEWSIRPTMLQGNLVVVIASFIIQSIWNVVHLHPWFIIFYSNMFLMILGINQFCNFLNFINYCLKQISYSKNPENYPKFYSVIESLWLVLNDIYGQGITCIILTLYWGVLHHLYNLFSLPNVLFMLKFNSFALGATYTIILLQIILTCQKLSVQVKEFNMRLYEEQKYSKKLLSSEELKFHFETMEEFEFTAYHFFPVNVSLIGSMIVSGTTYLVTLLQFTPSGIQKSQ